MLSRILLLIGSHTAGDPVLDIGGHTAAGETGNRTLLCNASLFHYGEDPEVRRGRENFGQTG